MSPTFRPATEADYDGMMQLWKTCEGLGLIKADSREGISLLLRRNPGLSTVAECYGKIIASVLCAHDGRRGLMYHLAVAPDFRKRGIARTLVKKSMELLQQAGIYRGNVVVYRSNAEGQKFWEKMGWQRRDADVVMFSRNLDA
ncbi:MAG TPA: GNAT family N-acetyltransferase [Candidatus Saccharimonadales bacterium]|nr:GNAT family N-acetyltransferase [Candidatus Saccharimonadales bacterium]